MNVCFIKLSCILEKVEKFKSTKFYQIIMLSSNYHVFWKKLKSWKVRNFRDRDRDICHLLFNRNQLKQMWQLAAKVHVSERKSYESMFIEETVEYGTKVRPPISLTSCIFRHRVYFLLYLYFPPNREFLLFPWKQ